MFSKATSRPSLQTKPPLKKKKEKGFDRKQQFTMFQEVPTWLVSNIAESPWYTDRQRKLGNFCFGIGAAKCSLSQLSTVLGKQCWEAVVRNSLIGVVVAAVVRKSFIGSCYSAFYCGCRAGISPLAGAGLSLRAQRSHGKCIMTTFMHRKQG